MKSKHNGMTLRALFPTLLGLMAMGVGAPKRTTVDTRTGNGQLKRGGPAGERAKAAAELKRQRKALKRQRDYDRCIAGNQFNFPEAEEA